jgi:hypothetical protein
MVIPTKSSNKAARNGILTHTGRQAVDDVLLEDKYKDERRDGGQYASSPGRESPGLSLL